MAGINEELVQRVIDRATADAEYRSRLLADTRAAFEEVSGEPLPASFTARAVEAEDADAERAKGQSVLVLPAFGSGELGVEELEAVAGGLAEESLAASINEGCLNLWKCNGVGL
jgi:hypothetical protein